MPSVGKSTILSIVSSSKPKIAPYHFTTLSPNLGVVTLENRERFVMADLPGLIKGASEGIGLGDEFLRHAMRTKILAHVIDMGASEGRNPINDYEEIRCEVEKYDKDLAKKEELIVANKMDLACAKENLEKFKNRYPHKKIVEISCYENKGITEMLNVLAKMLKTIDEVKLYDKKDYVLCKYDEENPFTITKENNIWIVKGHDIETLLQMTRFDESEGVERFSRKFKGMGIEDALKEKGAKAGDEVQILDYMFVFKC